MTGTDTIKVKICGLKTAAALAAAVEGGADFVGFNHYTRSSRFIEPEDAAALIADLTPEVTTVALLVDPDDELVARARYAHMIQLHGGETPERCAEIARATGKPVCKAQGIATAEDLARAETYNDVATMLLLDAKPTEAGALPGGNGIAFDWRLLQNAKPTLPWMLAGGLTPETVKEAIRLTGALIVDVSSGVEDAPGVKSEARIRAFLAAAKG